MAELTGLDSILERSHYKTERRHKYSFGKSQRFPDLKSTYHSSYLDIQSIITTSPYLETPGLAVLATARSTSSISHQATQVHCCTICPIKKGWASLLGLGDKYLFGYIGNTGWRLPQKIHKKFGKYVLIQTKIGFKVRIT